ncbi:hypothetical protein PVAND_008221 [Polypedilum vanderplanki]|uniref:Uncharacterized protein n=1 Tax=Polypedilum vanderplanki TaxID=319348 RepID=A0A9J6C8T2_POLVA|nr:hypothetical protein PVAND_008221 [Polypedilum vanderplanki]
MNYYQILQVSKNATQEEIKQAYQNLVRKHHPDKNLENEGSEKFLEIDKAYKIIKDPALRKIYDSELFQKESSHLIIHNSVTKKDFTYDEEENIYYYECKCGSFYTIDNNDNSTSEDIILSCDECSLNILVKN